MKKALFVCLCATVAFIAIAADYTPVTEESAGTVSGSLVASGSGYIAGTPQISAVTNVVTTSFTPQYAGQLLIGTVSNVVYVAEDATTNGWVQLSN